MKWSLTFQFELFLLNRFSAGEREEQDKRKWQIGGAKAPTGCLGQPRENPPPALKIKMWEGGEPNATAGENGDWSDALNTVSKSLIRGLKH